MMDKYSSENMNKGKKVTWDNLFDYEKRKYLKKG